jgi:choline dehydrogenase
MGEDTDSPVDTKLRLKGVGRIRIADASVIPVVPVSALNAPSMMIGYRLVDFILSENSN